MSAAVASGVVPSGGRVWWEDHLAREADWAWCWVRHFWERDAIDAAALALHDEEAGR